MALVFMLPLFFMITGSLRKAGLPPPTTLGQSPTNRVRQLPQAFDKVDIPWYTLNSLYVVAVAVPLTVLVAPLGRLRDDECRGVRPAS